MIYFASGANSAGEILGLAKAGHPVGIAAPEVAGDTFARRKAQKALVEAAAYGVPLFADSGAFSAFRSGAPLTPAAWAKNFELYRQLASVYGERLYAVAPDVVADQQATLRELERYASELVKLAELGARVIVPLQRGELSLAQMHAEAQAALDRGVGGEFPVEVVWGIPSNAAAYDVGSSGEVIDWACAMKPSRVHLLGIGPGRRGLSDTLATLGGCAPEMKISTDSNLLRILRGRKGGVKPMTAAEDEVRAALESCGVPVPGETKAEKRWATSAAVKMAACQQVVLGRMAHRIRRETMPTLNWRGYRSGYRSASKATTGVYVITHRGSWWTTYYGPNRREPSEDRKRLGRAKTYRQAKVLASEYEKALTGVGAVKKALESQLDAAAEKLPPKRDAAMQWVRARADEFMAEGKPAGQAWAIAWSIYCKRMRDKIPDEWGHCRKDKDAYLKKAARKRGARKAAKTRKAKAKAARARATARLRAQERKGRGKKR